MNKRSYFTYLALLIGALFSTCFSEAVRLPEKVDPTVTIRLATELKVRHSIGYSDESNEYSRRLYPVHFVTHKHVLALVDEPEIIQKIKYEIGPGFFIPISVKSSSTIHKVGPYSVVLYELEKAIEDATPLKLSLSIEDLLKKTLYVFTYGEDRKAKTAFTKGAGKEQGFIKVPFHTEDMEESESPEPDGFLIGHEDFGCSLVSKDGDSLILLGLGISNDEHHSYFVSLSDEMIEKVTKEVVRELEPKDTPLTASPILTDLGQDEEEEKPQNVSPTTDEESIQQGELLNTSTPPTLDLTNAISLTDISSLPSPSTTEEPNLFDHPLEWQVGDKVEIRPDGLWVVTHPDGKQERRLGLLPPDAKQGESLSFKVKEVAKAEKSGAIILTTWTDPNYLICPQSIGLMLTPKNDSILIYTNGWVCTLKSSAHEWEYKLGKNAVQGWEYKEPQNPLLNKKRRKTLPDGTIITVYTDGGIKWKKNNRTITRCRDFVQTEYENGIIYAENPAKEVLSLSGMIFSKCKSSDWELCSAIERHRKPRTDIRYTLQDGTKITRYVSDGRAEWRPKDGSKKVYHLDGTVTHIPATSSPSSQAKPSQTNLPTPSNGVTRPTSATSVSPTPSGSTNNSAQATRAPSIDASPPTAFSTTRTPAPPITRNTPPAKKLDSIIKINTSQGPVEEMIYSNGQKQITLPNGMVFIEQGNKSWTIISGETKRLTENWSHTLSDGTRVTIYAQINEVHTTRYSSKGELIKQIFSPPPITDQVNTSISRTARAATNSVRNNGMAPTATLPVQAPQPAPSVQRRTSVSSTSSNSRVIAKPSPSRNPQNNPSSLKDLASLGNLTELHLDIPANGAKPKPSAPPTRMLLPLVSNQVQTSDAPLNKIAAYEKAKSELLVKLIQSKTFPAKGANEYLELTVFPHGLVYEIDKTGLAEFVEKVTYAPGLCLIKKRRQSSYTFRLLGCIENGQQTYKYPLGVKEICNLTKSTITVTRPTGEKFHINCREGFGEMTSITNDRNYINYKQVSLRENPPIVTFDWNEEEGLKVHLPSPDFPVSTGNVNLPKQPSTTTSFSDTNTQYITPSTTSTNSETSIQAPTQRTPTPQTPGIEAYEKLKKEVGYIPTVPEITIDETSTEIKFPHGVEYDLKEKKNGKSKEAVTYAKAGLCLAKAKGESHYTCSRYLCAGSKSEKSMYPSGVIEICDPIGHKITVWYPKGESLHIHCESGTIKSYHTNNNLCNEGNLFGDQPTALLDWDENRGLTATFIPPTPSTISETTSTTTAQSASSPTTNRKSKKYRKNEVRRFEDGPLKKAIFPHGVTHEKNKEKNAEFEEKVTYDAGLCLTKNKGQNHYIASMILSANTGVKSHKYLSGAKETCDLNKNTIFIWHADGKKTYIDCQSGAVEFRGTNYNLSNKGNLYGIHPTVTLHWSEEEGLIPTFLSPASIPAISPVTSPLQQTNTTTSITNQPTTLSPTGTGSKEYRKQGHDKLQRTKNGSIEIIALPHGIVHEIDKTGLAGVMEKVTYAPGLCLTKQRGQSHYTCSSSECTKVKERTHKYPSEVRETCNPDYRTITVTYPYTKQKQPRTTRKRPHTTGQQLCINCRTGHAVLKLNFKVVKEGNLFGDKPTVTLDWDEQTGLTAHFISPDEEQTHTTTSTTQSSPSTTSVEPGTANTISLPSQGSNSIPKTVAINSEEDKPTKRTKRKKRPETSPQTTTQSQEKSSSRNRLRNSKKDTSAGNNVSKKQKATEQNRKDSSDKEPNQKTVTPTRRSARLKTRKEQPELNKEDTSTTSSDTSKKRKAPQGNSSKTAKKTSSNKSMSRKKSKTTSPSNQEESEELAKTPEESYTNDKDLEAASLLATLSPTTGDKEKLAIDELTDEETEEEEEEED